MLKWSEQWLCGHWWRLLASMDKKKHYQSWHDHMYHIAKYSSSPEKTHRKYLYMNIKIRENTKIPWIVFLYFPKCPEDFSSRGLILTIINHHRPLEPILDAKIPDIPNDHRSIHISIPRRNAYEIIGASGRFHSIFTAFWRTSIENGSLFHGDGHT